MDREGGRGMHRARDAGDCKSRGWGRGRGRASNRWGRFRD